METLANKMKEIENEFSNFQIAKDWALKNGAQEIFDRKPTSLGTVFQFPDKSEVSFDPAFGKDHIIVVVEDSSVVLKKNPHHNVYDEKHLTMRVYFYFKDYESAKAAEDACYEHRNSIPKLSTKEIYTDYENKGYYFFL